MCLGRTPCQTRSVRKQTVMEEAAALMTRGPGASWAPPPTSDLQRPSTGLSCKTPPVIPSRQSELPQNLLWPLKIPVNFIAAMCHVAHTKFLNQHNLILHHNKGIKTTMQNSCKCGKKIAAWGPSWKSISGLSLCSNHHLIPSNFLRTLSRLCSLSASLLCCLFACLFGWLRKNYLRDLHWNFTSALVLNSDLILDLIVFNVGYSHCFI